MTCFEIKDENRCAKNKNYCPKTCGRCKPNDDLGLLKLK